MEFLVVGLNHRTAPLEVRERLAVSKDSLPEALRAMQDRGAPGVILCTCNRSEFYTLEPTNGAGPTARRGSGDEIIKEFLVHFFQVSLVDVERYMYVYRHEECIHHLFRVSAGLDSMILGETQILGQVRDALAAAAKLDTVQGPLSHLFHQALQVGKRVRRETGISRNAQSVSRACVELAKSLLGDLRRLRVMVVGSGEAGKLVATALRLSGVKEILVTNRTYERALELAQELSGEAIAFPDMPAALRHADIAICATGSPGFVLEATRVREAMAERPERPLFLIDIAVPRDIDPAAGEVRNVFLYDVDDLEIVSEFNQQEKEHELQWAEEIVTLETARFMAWFHTLEALPTVIALRNRAEAIRKRELNRALKSLEHPLTPREQESLEAMTRAIMQKLLHQPTVYLKAHSDPQRTRLVREVFNLAEQETSSSAQKPPSESSMPRLHRGATKDENA